MSDATFTLEQRVGFGWCVVGPDGEPYGWFLTEWDAQAHATYLEWMWAPEAEKKLHRRPRHMWGVCELAHLEASGYAGACAHVLAGHLAWTVDETATTLAELRDDFDEVEEIGTCSECGLIYRTK